MSRFLSLIQLAKQNNWCMTPYCTTCGATDFRAALRQCGAELADDLANLDLSALEEMPGWSGVLHFALNELKDPVLMDRVLTMWLPQIDRHIRLADFVLFYYVRRGALFAPMTIEVLQQWRVKCINLAALTSDESLVESLIYTLGNYRDVPALDAVVRDLVASGSRRVSLALKRQNPVA